MTDEILFAERQKFRQWWLWLILIVINGIFILGIYKQLIERQQFGDKPISNEGLLIGFAVCFLLTVLFLNLRLETIIKKDGIYVRFFPIHRAFRKYTWDRIDKCFVREYNAITEYGGWGFRRGLSGNALNVSGYQGLQLVFTDNKKLLIGTNKAEELAEALTKIGQLKR